MLIERPVTAGGASYLLLVNLNECEICRRPRAVCLAQPWPNHTFTPATVRAEDAPTRWALLPRIPENEAHHASYRRLMKGTP